MIIGLTGGIGVGKSFVANCFKELGAALFDADSTVHQIYQVNKNIIGYAAKYFPSAVLNGKINRLLLLEYFLAYGKHWKIFEFLVHRAVFQKFRLFLNQERKISRKFLILDIPLLLETKLHLYCDSIVFIHTNRIIQNQRLNKRNITIEQLNLITNLQFSIKLKRQLSHFTLNAGGNKGYVIFQVKQIMNILQQC